MPPRLSPDLFLNRQFGQLTVRADAGKNKAGKYQWECLCECGTTVLVVQGNLQSGNTTSCGCLQKAGASERMRTRDIGPSVIQPGQRYGRWMVLEKSARPTMVKGLEFPQFKHWTCRCDCGTVMDVIGNSMRQGHSTSCGCLHRERVNQPYKLAVGQVYGRLTVLRRSDRKTFYPKTNCMSRQHWVCQCTCGNVVETRGSSLRNGHAGSCGCLAAERRRAACTKHGQSKTPAYVTMKARERNERKRKLDIAWTLEMDNLLRELQSECVVCESTYKLCVDHVKPLSAGHGLRPGNAVILCVRCNTRKLNKPLSALPTSVATKIKQAAANFATAWAERDLVAV